MGGFHVRTFSITGEQVQETPTAVRADGAFRKRHFCATRGNNIQAYRWIDPHRLVLVTSVYPTGDCGRDLGHTEAFIVQAPDGRIVNHMAALAFRRYAAQHPE